MTGELLNVEKVHVCDLLKSVLRYQGIMIFIPHFRVEKRRALCRVFLRINLCDGQFIHCGLEKETRMSDLLVTVVQKNTKTSINAHGLQSCGVQIIQVCISFGK